MEWLLAHPEGEDDEEDDEDDEVMDQGSLMLFKSTFLQPHNCPVTFKCYKNRQKLGHFYEFYMLGLR
jgi:hypothetical protein